MILLLGPCMFFAPLVLVLVPIAIVLWPPTLVLLGIGWLLTWPFARGGDRRWLVRTHRAIGRWFRSLLTPWTYFDEPTPPRSPTDDAEDVKRS